MKKKGKTLLRNSMEFLLLRFMIKPKMNILSLETTSELFLFIWVGTVTVHFM
jgi:hypothetical protein